MPNRSPVLDGIRGLAVSLVLLWHYGPCLFPIIPESNTLGRLLYELAAPSETGVDLFFVLSGFLIGGILLDHRGAPNFFRVFYQRRVGRIFPLYYGWLIIYAVVVYFWPPQTRYFQQIFNHQVALWPCVLFLQNQAGNFISIFPHTSLAVTWSLAVEEQFYLLIPLLIFLLPRRALTGLMVLAIVSAPFARWHYPAPQNIIYTVCRWDALALGVLLALTIRTPRIWIWLQAHRPRLFWCWLALFLISWFHAFAGIVSYAVYQTFLNFTWAGLLFLAVSRPEGKLGKSLSHPILTRAGILSYAIYLFHEPILHSIFPINGVEVSQPYIYDSFDVVLVIVALAGTWMLASLLHRFIEQPIITWVHRTPYQERITQSEAPGIMH